MQGNLLLYEFVFVLNNIPDSRINEQKHAVMRTCENSE